MKIVLAGCTGFIGRRLVNKLAEDGHECTVLIRSVFANHDFPDNVRLAPYGEMPDVADGVINLAGETIVGRWTRSKKLRIADTRVDVTRHLVTWMEGLKAPPSVFLSGSAVGFYGDRGEDLITEATGPDPAKRFRCQLCIAWEDAANEAQRLGVRVVNLRTGNVLDPEGGMLGKMVPMLRRAPMIVPYARKSFLPWISMNDTIGIVHFLLTDESAKGPFNLVAPTPATNGDFMEILGKILKKRVVGEMPSFALKALLGEFSEALLESQRIIPERVVHQGYAFQDVELSEYLAGLSLRD